MLLLALIPLSVNAQIIESGICGNVGNNLTWELDDEGTVVIRGNGKMDIWRHIDPDSPWANNYSIKKVVIEEGVTSIGSNAFIGCSYLTSISIPSSIESIGEYSFCGCVRLSQVLIPDGVKYIGDSAFWACYNLTNITLPDSITSIDGWAFGCTNLMSVTIPSSVTYLDNGAFMACEKLKEINVDERNPNYLLMEFCIIKIKLF